VGENDGEWEGDDVGENDGEWEGEMLGLFDGEWEGEMLGDVVGANVSHFRPETHPSSPWSWNVCLYNAHTPSSDNVHPLHVNPTLKSKYWQM